MSVHVTVDKRSYLGMGLYDKREVVVSSLTRVNFLYPAKTTQLSSVRISHISLDSTMLSRLIQNKSSRGVDEGNGQCLRLALSKVGNKDYIES